MTAATMTSRNAPFIVAPARFLERFKKGLLWHRRSDFIKHRHFTEPERRCDWAKFFNGHSLVFHPHNQTLSNIVMVWSFFSLTNAFFHVDVLPANLPMRRVLPADILVRTVMTLTLKAISTACLITYLFASESTRKTYSLFDSFNKVKIY